MPTTPMDLYADAELEIELRIEAWRGALAAARDDIARFQAFCEVLHEHGLEFTAQAYPATREIHYWIHLTHPSHAKHAGEMMLTLAALECEELPDPGLSHECSTILAIKGPHAPDFCLAILRPLSPATKPLAEDCHAD